MSAKPNATEALFGINVFRAPSLSTHVIEGKVETIDVWDGILVSPAIDMIS